MPVADRQMADSRRNLVWGGVVGQVARAGTLQPLAIQRTARVLALAVTAVLLAFSVSCGGGSSKPASSPSSTSEAGTTPEASPTPEAPKVQEGAAVYLSLGDYVQFGCCGDSQPTTPPAFAAYLSQRLARPVQYVTLAQDESAADFIAGVNGQRPSQLDRAVSAIKQYQAGGHPVVAITLSIGGRDFQQLSDSCMTDCGTQLLQFLERYREQLGLVYSRLNQALATATPILQTNYYDLAACGEATAGPTAGVDISAFNQRIAEVASDNSGFLVDIASAVSPAMCAADGRPNDAGFTPVEAQYQAAYEKVPAIYLDPFVQPSATP